MSRGSPSRWRNRSAHPIQKRRPPADRQDMRRTFLLLFQISLAAGFTMRPGSDLRYKFCLNSPTTGYVPLDEALADSEGVFTGSPTSGSDPSRSRPSPPTR